MAGVALVFAMGVVMSGLAASFSREIDRTLDAVGAETWAVSEQASGPFTSFTPVPIELGQGAAPVMVLRQTIRVDGTVEDIVVLGVDPTRLGAPDPDDGAALSGRGQVVVDEATFILPLVWAFVMARGEASALKTASPQSWLFLGLSAVATGISWLAYFRALQLAPASHVAPIDKLSLPLTVALAALVLGEPLTLKLTCGVALMVIGAMLTLG